MVEMLIVLGIIALLASLLIPGLISARKAAQTTSCLNNLRQLGFAVTQYLNDNRMCMPDACSSNCWDDPASPRGALERGSSSDRAPIGQLLDSYLKHDLRLWKCPGAPQVSIESDGQMRQPHVVASKDSLWQSNGQWRPAYFYLSTRGWEWFQINQPLVWQHFWMQDWMVRNLAGLKLERTKTVSIQPPTEIVVFLDYSSAFHSKSPSDLYDVPQTLTDFNNVSPTLIQRQPFRSNLLYLDGHCATREYTWAGGLINLLHKPIKQVWGDLDFEQTYADAFQNHYPD